MYRIPKALARDGSPIKMEVTPLPADSPYNPKRIALIHPYVLDPTTGGKMFFAESAQGDYRPIAGTALIKAKLNRSLLRFDIWVFTEKLDTAVKEIASVTVTDRANALSAGRGPYQGFFKDLTYQVRMQTYGDDRLIEESEQRWAMGNVADTGEEYWALFITPTKLENAVTRTKGTQQLTTISVQGERPVVEPAAAAASVQPKAPSSRPTDVAAAKPGFVIVPSKTRQTDSDLSKKTIVVPPGAVTKQTAAAAPLTAAQPDQTEPRGITAAKPEPAAPPRGAGTPKTVAAPTGPRPSQPDKIPLPEPPEPAAPELKPINAVVFSLVDVPLASRARLSTASDIIISGARLNQKKALLRTQLLQDRFEILPDTGTFFENDRLNFVLHLPGLHPETISMVANERITPPYALQQHVNIRVLDADHAALPDIRLQTKSTNHPEPRTARPTDAHGNVIIPLDRGSHEVTLSFPGDATFEALTETLRLAPTVSETSRTITLPWQQITKKIQVGVTSGDNQPLDDVTIKLTWEYGPAEGITLSRQRDSDAVGRYGATITARPGAHISINASAAHYDKKLFVDSRPFGQINETIKMTLEAIMVKRNLAVTVSCREDSRDKPLPNAKVAVSYRDVTGKITHHQLTFDRQTGEHSALIQYPQAATPRLTVTAGSMFSPYQAPVTSDRIHVVMNHNKPLLYVFINPSNQMKRGPIRDNPANNFGRFKESFLYLVEALDSSNGWKDRFGKVYIYSVNRNQAPTVLREPDGLKISWQDRAFRQEILNRIRLGNSFVPYEDVASRVIDSLAGFSFGDDLPIHGVFLYILGSPPELILDPTEELKPLETMLADAKVRGVIAEYAASSVYKRQNFTYDSEVFTHLRLLHLNIDQEFKDNFFGSSMDYIKATLETLILPE